MEIFECAQVFMNEIYSKNTVQNLGIIGKMLIINVCDYQCLDISTSGL